MAGLVTYGLLRVVCRIEGGEAYRVVYEDWDPVRVSRKYHAEKRKHGAGEVAVVNGKNWRMCLKRMGGGRNSGYAVVPLSDMTDEGIGILTYLQVVEP